MKIQVNLLSEESSIIKNNGHYLKVFTLTEQVKRYTSKKGLAQLVINPGTFLGLHTVVLNDRQVGIDMPARGLLQRRWNVPIKIRFDQELLNLDGYNKLELKLL